VKSIRAKLFLSIGLAVLLSIGLTLGLGIVLTRRSVERSILSTLESQADVVAVRAANTSLTAQQKQALRVFFRRRGERLLILQRPLPAGRLVPPTEISAEIRSAVDAGTSVEGSTTVAGTDLLYAVRPAGDQAVVLVRAATLGSSDWRPFLSGFVIAGLVGAALAGVASFLLARVISRPVVRVAEASRKLAGGEVPDPVPVEGSDELALLAESFNDMAEQLRAARRAEQSFLLSVSHELKTPLTAIKGYAEGLEDGEVDPREAGEVIGREEARLERLVLDLLDLARLNQRMFAVRHEPVDLAVVARDCVQRYEVRARGFDVTLSAQGTGPAEASGDPDRVLQAVSNLVENALRSTPAGGSVTVVSRPGEIEVRDTGPGLSQDDLPRAFERFFLYRRYGGERPVGTGLGLAIVKDLTEAMGGSVEVRSAPGQGTSFFLRLPPPGPRPDEASP
jgi:two-component system, OmpR family, sensor kinase